MIVLKEVTKSFEETDGLETAEKIDNLKRRRSLTKSKEASHFKRFVSVIKNILNLSFA